MVNSGHDSSSIRITLNGEERELPAGLTIRGLLERLELHERLVVVERNREIVRREEYAEVTVSAGDTIELVHFVGGG
jgi:thiamine biosynthesis protein ThiS